MLRPMISGKNKLYYGEETEKALQNFPITKNIVSPKLISDMILVKMAAAHANVATKIISKEIGGAIMQAGNEALTGKFADSFVTNEIQGGAGTSMHLNVCEVLANRATEILQKKKMVVKANDHVNACQSTNDVVPTAIRITTFKLVSQCISALTVLQKSFQRKAKQFDDVLKVGRTHLQDAVPIRLGQEFATYVLVCQRGIERFKTVLPKLLEVNLGGTAIGTGINASRQFIYLAVKKLGELTGLKIKSAPNLIDSTQNVEIFIEVSGMAKTTISALSKISNDLRLLSSGPKCGFGEIILPPLQKGSSIMPGKVNPVIPEMINQIAFQIIGHDVTINLAAEAGQLELNVYFPVLSRNLLESLEIFGRGVKIFAEKCVNGITANRKRCQELFTGSISKVTTISPAIGYENAAKIAAEALQKNKSVESLVIEKKLLTKEEYRRLTDPKKLTNVK